MPIPVILNRQSGSADAWHDAIAADGRFALAEVEPDDLTEAVRDAARAGARRVAVAGGDGSLASAASELMETGAELAVLPAGTLNHFAAHVGVPADDRESALDVAAGGVATPVDVGHVGERTFVNTSAVGAYVTFVRLRERLERALPYWLASLVAGIAILFRMPRFRVEVEIEGEARSYVTPLVFVGVGERATTTPDLAALVPGGRRGLHVIVVRGRRRARMLALGLAAARGGARAVSRMPDVDSFVVDRCRIYMGRHRMARVAMDGEMHRLHVPLDYRLVRDRLRVVLPVEVAAALGTVTEAAG